MTLQPDKIRDPEAEAHRRRARLVLARVLSHPGFTDLRRRWHRVKDTVYAIQWEMSIEFEAGKPRWFVGDDLVALCLAVEDAIHEDAQRRKSDSKY